MSEQQRALEAFLRQADCHTAEVLLDQGRYRHVKCTDSGSQIYRFDLITWPGHLHVTGDMGDWTFARLPDMFEFFRQDDLRSINPVYWSQKLKAHPKDSPPKHFNPKAVMAAIKEDFDRLMEGEEDPLVVEEYWEELEDNFAGVENEHDFYEACLYKSSIFPQHDWYHMLIDDGMGPYMEFSFHYCWVLYAILWGIREYDWYKERTNNGSA